jgi:hypothetical protein
MFVGRYQAHRIAYQAGQTARAPRAESELNREDVW